MREGKMMTNIEKIDYFRHDGKNEKPNGMYIVKGFLYSQIMTNKASFRQSPSTKFFLAENPTNKQLVFSKYKGGMIVFPNNIKFAFDAKNVLKTQQLLQEVFAKVFNVSNKDHKAFKLVRKWRQEIDYTDEKVEGNFNFGYCFKGKYISENSAYNENSVTVEIKGVPPELLLLFGAKLSALFTEDSVLIKDFTDDEVYITNKNNFGSKNKIISRMQILEQSCT